MKKLHLFKIFLIAGIFCISFQFLQAQNQPTTLIINDKVGSIIDSDEKLKYCLFPEYSDDEFGKAIFIKYPGGKIMANIYLKDGSTYNKTISKETYNEYKKQVNKKEIDYSKLDTSYIYSIRLIDETILYGRILKINEKDIVFKSTYLETFTIPKIKIDKIEKKMSIIESESIHWFPNPHETRHFFAPSARCLTKGEGYFQDIYVFLGAVNYGITDHFTIGGGFSFLPFNELTKQLLFLNPKIGYQLGDRFNLGGGAFYISIPNETDGKMGRTRAGIIYGIGTYGTKENNISLGAGYAGYNKEILDYPIITLGGMYRISRRMAFVTENWFLAFDFEKNDYNQKYFWDPMYGLHAEDDEHFEMVYNKPHVIISYGLRFFSEKLCVDLGFFNGFGEFVDNQILEGGKSKFLIPGIPYLDFVVKF